MITEFGVRYHDVLDFERFNLRINLSTNSWGGLDFGSINLVSYEPLQVNRLAELLPVKWAEILPAGELLLDWHTSFQDAELADSVAKINAQALQWQEDDEVLPNSVGIELRWNPRLDANLDNTIANFELVNVQLDNQFITLYRHFQIRFQPLKLNSSISKRLILVIQVINIQITIVPVNIRKRVFALFTR
ncbi:hypothetical protein THIOSC15_2030002 [uncultured Thiomicrorhabdus sp.]